MTQPEHGGSAAVVGRRGRPRVATPASERGTAFHSAVASSLGRHGVRYTAPRRRIVAALGDARQPLTIPQLVDAAAVPQSSVYRNLAIFDEAGIVHRMPGAGDDFARYELAEELMGHHHHLVCSTCGTVEDVTLPERVEAELERQLERIAKQRGFTLASHRLDLVGDCGHCG